jgi:2-keto-4-pentenoate hydratase/2-oxohepta-3-ene-1,7-dioic acid hydratase in catechol pathway
MKFATYRGNGREALGVLDRSGERLLDLRAAAMRSGTDDLAFGTMLSLIDGGDAIIERARYLLSKFGADEDLLVPSAGCDLLAPLPEPRQMRDGMSFPIHILQSTRGAQKLRARESGDEVELARLEAMPLPELPEVYRQRPIYYITNRFSVQGTNTTVNWPRYSTQMDYELEFGIVTKGRGSNISATRARNHIFGFTIFNDFSARDAQRLEMEGRLGPAKGKSFDGGNVLGPWIVTPDEIGDPYNLQMRALVNGEVWSDGNSKGMLFSFEEMIEHISRDETLMPGEFIGSGTVGNGCGLELDRFLKHGDMVELEVEKIGRLRNRVERQDLESS